MAVIKIVSLTICMGMLSLRIEKMQITLQESGKCSVVTVFAFKDCAQTC